MFPPPAGPHIALHFLLPSHATRGVWTRRPQQETISVSLASLTVLGVCNRRPQEATTTAPAEDPKEVRVNWTRGDEGLPARDTGRTAFSASRADCRAQYRHQEEQHLCPNRTHIYRKKRNTNVPESTRQEGYEDSLIGGYPDGSDAFRRSDASLQPITKSTLCMTCYYTVLRSRCRPPAEEQERTQRV